MDPPDYTRYFAFCITNRYMKYEWLLPFMTETERGAYDAWQLLMIETSRTVTFEQVTSIKAALNHNESYKEETQCTLFKKCMTYRDGLAPLQKATRERHYERVIEDAEESNAALAHIDMDVLTDIMFGHIHTVLTGKEIFDVTSNRKPKVFHGPWRDTVSTIFQGREGQVPQRATELVKESRPGVYEGVVDIGDREKKEWIRTAKYVLGGKFIGMKSVTAL
ncbi:MAG: hypothetical protein Q9212_007178 [Teloschistes hypoglaucus]